MHARAKPKYHVGDWVLLKNYPSKIKVKIIEFRGALLGPERKHLYRVERHDNYSLPEQFDVGEDSIEPTTPPGPRQDLDAFPHHGG
jgi:hypothetical protein